MGLGQYHKKRDFSKTPEPKGIVNPKDSHLFIIQKHAASHLHYDFRLELHGVLKSWAVPKGPSLDPKVKRLAMHVEDHPIEYGNFEGIIPKGQYGGGTVMLWDKGSWEPLDPDPYLAYEKGHLRFELHAEKLKGRWDLIRFKDEKHWFLIKYDDEFAKNQSDYEITEKLNKSIKTNQTMEQIAKNAEDVWESGGSKKRKSLNTKLKSQTPVVVLPKGLHKVAFPDFIPPQLATLVDTPPSGENWLHEVKFDGYRILAFKNGDDVVLKSRNNKDWTQDLLPITEAIKELPYKNIILDGEVVLLDKEGKSDFQLLQNSIKNKKYSNFVYFLFDILYFDQYDLRNLPLIERKSILKNILNFKSSTLTFSDHIVNEGQLMFEHSCEYALEGIISKRIESTYTSKRSKDWLKIKCLKRQEFVIGGYTPPKGGRKFFGSLFLGVFNDKGELEYAGNVGTGFTESSLKTIHNQLVDHKAQKNPFTTNPPGHTTATWVKPTLVAEIEFTEWTQDGHLRHPSFKGMRVDKKANEVTREREILMEEIKEEKKEVSSKASKKSMVKLTHPSKILYPEDNITKQDLYDYYEAVSDYMLPYLTLRPLTLVRCPDDYGTCFYQRHYNKGTPKFLHPVEMKNEDEIEKYIYLNDRQGLLSLIQMGVLEIHPWGSTISHLDQPDIIIFDLDPAPDVPWRKVVEGAREVRKYLEEYNLQSFVKSTGGKGLHVVIPIKPEYDWEEIKNFTKVFVQFLEQIKPQNYISKMTKSKRSGKIFVDYLRNQKTATAIGPYSTRARLHAPIATPLSWDELSDRMEDNTFNMRALLLRLKNLKEDPWKNFWDVKQSLGLDKL
ncbi:DNA ligase D [Legionella sp. PC997]|uniref:DNA ligase D n=1 Tax=Legionella sp. PC997 TaxID=2755562 RepID=UPI0015FC418C|nr:DNA ligase D [Legionella sp. PC997]QMT59805.1 Multifunctional non-homologous end joining protein LigD [Legionella sp. PC997]